MQCSVFERTIRIPRWAAQSAMIEKSLDDKDQDQQWGVWIYPSGKVSTGKKGVYVDLGVNGATLFSKGWYRDVHFTLRFINHKDDQGHKDCESVGLGAGRKSSRRRSASGWAGFGEIRATRGQTSEDTLHQLCT